MLYWTMSLDKDYDASNSMDLMDKINHTYIK